MSAVARSASRVCLLMAIGLASGCGGGNTDEPASAAAAPSEVVLGAAPEPAAPALEPTAGRVDRLKVEELRVGNGATAGPRATVVIRYVAGEARTAKEVGSTYEQEAPLGVKLGAGLLPPGLERGIAGMREGGRRRIEVPRRLARGHRALVYVVDLVKVL